MKGIYYFENSKKVGISSVGVRNKISQQIRALEKISDLIVIEAIFNDSIFEKLKFLLPRLKSDREKQVMKILDVVDDDVDYIYIRKPSLAVEFYKVLKKIKIKFPKIYILLEIPTYPFHSEYTKFSKLMILKSINCEKKLKNVVDKIVTYSDDKEIWGIPTIETSNCVSYKDVLPRSSHYKLEKGTIRLTCVANFMYWHGVDRLINGIKDYNGDYEIILNIVGDGKEIKKLKRLSKGMKNIIFHGIKTGDDLLKIFNETDIAVDALGRHRSGVSFNSSLKGKEYVAMGIPVISAVRTDLDNIPNFLYYYRFPADESHIDIEKIIEFYNAIYFDDTLEDITMTIRKTTEKMFDYQYGFIDKIQGELKNGK